jgi:hypothetical protein
MRWSSFSQVYPITSKEPPNEGLISCKRPLTTLWSTAPLGASLAQGPRLPAFVGCISGLGLREPEQHLLDVLERLLRTRVQWITGQRFPEALQRIQILALGSKNVT